MNLRLLRAAHATDDLVDDGDDGIGQRRIKLGADFVAARLQLVQVESACIASPRPTMLVVATVTKLPDSQKDTSLQTGWMKIAVALIVVFVLLCGGLRGRQQASMEAKLDDITFVRDQLQQKLDDPNTGASKPGPQVNTLANSLRIEIQQFESDYKLSQLSETDNLELRLSEATLANAEQRFRDALSILSDQDEQRNASPIRVQTRCLFRVFLVRGDSFYGLHEWQKAWDRYRQVLSLQSNRVETIRRAAICQSALGNKDQFK